MITRLGVYRRWRRWKVLSLSYPLAMAAALMLVPVGLYLLL